MDDRNLGFDNELSVLSRLPIAHRDLLNSLPLTVLFDYAMAFPSVCNASAFFLLSFVGMPEGLVDAIRAVYKMNKAYMNTPSGIVFMFLILSGVLQGCPLSGSLFVIAIDPSLHMFKTMLKDSSVAWVRACADDIGTSLTQFRHLPVVKILFDDFTFSFWP